MLHCPRCQTGQAEGTRACINCGEPLELPWQNPAEAPPSRQPIPPPPAKSEGPPSLPARPSSWKMPVLVAGLMLAFLGGTVFFLKTHPPLEASSSDASSSHFSSPPVTLKKTLEAAAPPPVPYSATPAFSAAPAALQKTATPMTISLEASSQNDHVPVGSPVTITALTTLATGQSAHIAISYQLGSGPRTLISFALGSLCSAAWTPLAPGTYTFTATALADHGQTALSPGLKIIVDSPRSSVAAAPPPPAPRRARRARLAKRPPGIPRGPAASQPAPRQPRPLFHVIAAQFPRSQNADILANALQSQGLPAIVRQIPDRRGRDSFVVETGAYHGKAEAQKQSQTLQRSGYPAYYFSKP